MSKDVDDWFLRNVLPLEAELERFLYRHWHQTHEISDLRQEILTRLYKSALTQIPQNTRAMLYRVARNLLIDKIRRQKIVSMESVMDYERLDVLTDDAGPYETTSSRQELRLMQEALDSLPERTRNIVLLRRVHGLSQRETAKELKISEPTVERHIANGIRQLKDYFRTKGVVRADKDTDVSQARQNDTRS